MNHSIINMLFHLFAAGYMIYTGCIFRVMGDNSLGKLLLWLFIKILPIFVGIIFLFDLYAAWMGWPA